MTHRSLLQLDASVHTRPAIVLRFALLIGFLFLKMQGSAQSITITSTDPVAGSALCQLFDTIKVNYTRSGFGGGSVQFNLEISDELGNFPGQVISTTNSTGNGQIKGSPNGVVGSNYRLRIVSSNPAAISNTVGPFTLAPQPIPITDFVFGSSVCEDSPFNIQVTGTQDVSTYSWVVGTGSLSCSVCASTTYTAPYVANDTTIAIALQTDGIGACNSSNTGFFFVYPYFLNIETGPEVSISGLLSVCVNTVEVDFSASPSNISSYTWNEDGFGSFSSVSPDGSTYVPNSSDAGSDLRIWLTVSGNGSCSSVQATDSLVLHVDPLPEANVVQAIPLPFWCTTSGPHQIDASANATNASSFAWYVDPSLGSFNDPSLLAPLFTANPTAGGNIALSFIAYGEGGCATETNSTDFFVQLSPGAVADITTAPQTTCGQTAVAIEGYASGPGMWSNYQGTFLPNPSTIDATYTPAANEAGTTVTLVWTTNDPDGWQPCTSVTDQVSVVVNTSATANAGGPYTACGTAPVSITATANGPGSWSGGTGTFGNPSSASTTYTAALSEVGSTVLLTWTTTDPDANGPCVAVPSTATLTVVTPPNAGSSYTYEACSNDAQPVSLFAQLGGSPDTTGTWSGPSDLTGGYMGNYVASSMNAGPYTYTVSPPNGCPNPATATVTVTETTAANAGQNSSVDLCILGDPVNLISYLGNDITTGGSWNSTILTGPNGTFDPQADSSGTYTYTVEANGPCPADLASVTVTVVSAADAGNDTTLFFCSNGAAVALNTLSVNWSQGNWFLPNGTALGNSASQYNPSTMDYDTLTFVATTQQPCPNDTAMVTITEIPAPATPPITGVDLVMNSDTVCRGQYTTLVTSFIPGATYTWSCAVWDPDTFTGLELDTIAPLWSAEPGTATISLTITDGAGCTNSNTKAINLSPDTASCPKGIFYFEPHGLGVLDDQARWFEWGTVNTSQSTFIAAPTVQGYQSQTMFDPDQLAGYAGDLPPSPYYAVRTSRYADGHCSSFTTQWVTQELLDRACLLDNGGFGPDLGYRVYPNPVTAGELTVEALGQPSALPVEAALYDLGGRLMYAEQLPAGARATLHTDLGALGHGVYVLRLRNVQLENTFKVIIQ